MCSKIIFEIKVERNGKIWGYSKMNVDLIGRFQLWWALNIKMVGSNIVHIKYGRQQIWETRNMVAIKYG